MYTDFTHCNCLRMFDRAVSFLRASSKGMEGGVMGRRREKPAARREGASVMAPERSHTGMLWGRAWARMRLGSLPMRV